MNPKDTKEHQNGPRVWSRKNSQKGDPLWEGKERCFFTNNFGRVGPLRKVTLWGSFLGSMLDPTWCKSGPQWHPKSHKWVLFSVVVMFNYLLFYVLHRNSFIKKESPGLKNDPTNVRGLKTSTDDPLYRCDFRGFPLHSPLRNRAMF